MKITRKHSRRTLAALALAGLFGFAAPLTAAPDAGWIHLSSKTGDLAAPPGGLTPGPVDFDDIDRDLNVRTS